jgi:glycosyltransferase involved in cell wall biosynthesis
MLDGVVAVSAVVPIYNERENIEPLVRDLHAALGAMGATFEIILVDDGSRDGSDREILRCVEEFPLIRPLLLARNYGQSTALQAGFENAVGEVVVSLDGDQQNDPKDIARLVKTLLDEDVDMVSGWRRKRRDGAVRVFLSRIANRFISRLTGVKLHDYGCTLKAYRRDMLEQIRVYGELHRFIPALMAEVGAEVREMEVNHRPRLLGQSKYKLDRTIRVALDLLLVVFLRRYVQRPLHVFGGLGIMLGVVGAGLLGYLATEKFVFGQAIGDRPMLAFALTLTVSAVFLVVQGLLGELMIRLLHETGHRPQYRLKMSRKLTATPGRMAALER